MIQIMKTFGQEPCVREAEIVEIPFLGALAGCSARRSERRVASHTSEEQRRNAPASTAKNGILAFSASLSESPLIATAEISLNDGQTAATGASRYLQLMEKDFSPTSP